MKKKLLLFFSLFFTCFLFAQPDDKAVRQKQSADFVMNHVQDAHDFHIIGEGHGSISLPLPIILRTENGWHFFLSSAFHHDHAAEVVVRNGGVDFVRLGEKIYALQATGLTAVVQEGQVINGYLPLDFSFTRHAFVLLLTAVLMLLLFVRMAQSYRKNGLLPVGVSRFLEPLVVFVRDEIARPNLPSAQVDRFLPYLLTVFFFIWFNNLLGLVPFFPGSSNVTGDVAVTFTLATLTFILTHIYANKDYWKHIFAMPGLPVWLLPIMIPIEIVGMFSKPFALMVRLAVNMSAGHIIILSLITLIATFQNLAWAAFSVPFVLIMQLLELLVAFLQAYIFTLLSALFIGMATEEHEHH